MNSSWRRGGEDSTDYRRPFGNKRRRHQLEPEAEKERDLRTVFVRRLVPKVKEADVFDFFSRAGKVRDVRLIMDRRSSRHKGAGYVEFYNRDSVQKAISLAGGAICGFPVAVKPSSDENAPQSNNDSGFESTMKAGQSSSQHVVAPQPLLTTPSHAHANTHMPITAAVGWSMASRRPVRQVSSVVQPQETLPFSRMPSASTGVLPGQQSKLVSVKELAVMLNPNNLPINASTQASSSGVPTGSGLLEPVRLPTVAINALMGTQSSAPFTRLYVGSVPFHFGEADLHPIFAPFGTITSLQLQRDPATERSRGYGFVEFSDHNAAKNALSVNGRDVGGRPLKVALASQMSGIVRPLASGFISTGEVTGELDEGRDGGVLMNASQKALLRERLSRGEDFGANSLSPAGVPWRKALETTVEPFKSLLLSNMFDPLTEPRGFEEELAEDVRDECVAKYGTVTHLFVDKLSRGLVYVRFSSVEIAVKAMLSLNGRWFGGLRVSAAYINDNVYRTRFPDAPL